MSENGENKDMIEKAAAPEVTTAIERSRDAVGSRSYGREGTGPVSITRYVVQTSDLLPPWYSRRRDFALIEAVKKSEHLSGMAYAAEMKLVNIPMRFVPRDPTISAHVTAAEKFTRQIYMASELSQGLRETLKKWINDWNITDNGGFMEILGDGERDGPIIGMPWSVRHLDSTRCVRTGDPEFPVRYEDVETTNKLKVYKLHWTRVIYLAQQPSGLASMFGVGFSSVSRSFQIGQVLNDQIDYKMQKMGSRPSTKMVVGKNIEAEKLLTAFMVAQDLNDNLGLTRFANNIFIGGEDAEVNSVDLNNFDPFDEETGTLMAMYALSYIWGLDIRDIWPISGSKSNDQVANMKARGRLPAEYTNDLAEQFDLKLCPPWMKTSFDFQDDEQDQQTALVKDIRARRRERYAKAGILDQESERRSMVAEGDLDRQDFIRGQLADGKLEDGTPIATIFFSQDPIHAALTTLQGIAEPLVFEDNDKDDVFREIHVNEADCYAVMAAGSGSQKRKANESLAALQWLYGQYEEESSEVPDQLQDFMNGEEE